MAGFVLKGRFPRRPALEAAFKNAGRLVLRGALRNWIRNLSSTAPALGSMTMLLLLTGLVGILGFAVASLAGAESRDASVLHIYLKDSATSQQVSTLQTQLSHRSGVVSVHYTSKADALKTAQRRPGLPELAAATDSNPFPASLDVQLHSVDQVAALDAQVRRDSIVDPVYPTSYDRGAYQRIQQLLLWLTVIGGGFLALLGFVAVTVTANSIRAAIISRRDEVSIMQLVGAPRWMVRGPFVVEGALTGAVSGAIAGLATLVITVAAISAGAGSFIQIAPGLTITAALVASLLVFLGGLMLGSGSSLLGIRRYLEQ